MHQIDGSELVPKRVTKHRFRHSIFEAWDRLCAYCGEHADTLDHVRPRVKGGLTVRKNLIPACSICNRRKGHADALEWFRAHPGWTGERERRIVEWVESGCVSGGGARCPLFPL